AFAVDAAGFSLTSSVVNVTVVDPGVTILSPTDRTSFAGSNPGQILSNSISIQVYAWLPSGQITNVQFFVDGQKIGEDSIPAFSQAWTNVKAGLHRLTAIGTSDTGAIYRSPAVNI